MARAGRAPLALVALIAASAMAAPAAAGAIPPVPADLETLLPGPAAPTRGPVDLMGPGPLSGQPQVRDAIVKRGSRSAAGVEVAAAAQFQAPDGSTVTVRWGDASPYGPADAQEMVDFLASLMHGRELSGLAVFLATPAELNSICSGALACYSWIDEEMIISGNPGSQAGLSREFLVAHEYGHHVANNRNNRPFPAILFGPRYWSTQQRICPNVAAGRYEPAGAYLRRPGEAFAESFAFYHYPDETAWLWSLPHPSPASYRALERDTLKPWRRTISASLRRRVGGSDRTDAFIVRTPLDGRLVLKLRAHQRANLDLFLIARKRPVLLARSARGGGREKIKYLICGRGSFRVLVSARSGGSSYTLRASRP